MSVLDKVIASVSPALAVKRASNRARLSLLSQHQRRFEGGGYGHRFDSFYGKYEQSTNQAIHGDLKNLVTRSRNLANNNPYAKKAARTIANNVIGTGIVPTFTGPGLSRVKKAWKEWAETLVCDYNGDYNFYGQQKLAMRTIVTSGEILAIRKRVSSDVSKIGIQILYLEGDYIDQTKHDYTGGAYIGEEYDYYGIRYNKENKKVGYWVYDRNPLEGNIKSTLVPIDDIIHVYEVDRASQNRGIPFSASTILRQRDLDDYEDAEILGKKAASCMPIFVTNSDVEANLDAGEKIETLEPGTINYLKPGESVSLSQPPQNPGFSDFIRTQHRAIANGYGLTYEQFTGDLSLVNFSSGRMGYLEFQRQVDDWQYMMIIPKLCDKVVSWFLEACRIAFGIKGEITASWTPPRREMIDPVKELSALKNKVRSGFTSWQEQVRELGGNPDEVFAQMVEDQNRFESGGLMPESNPFFELAAKLKMQQGRDSGHEVNNPEK